MPTQFVARVASVQAIGRLSALDPANPFATAEFFECRRQLGDTAWVFELAGPGDRNVVSCGAFLKIGRLNRILHIPSMPAVGPTDAFWAGLRQFCSSQRVSELQLDSFGSADGTTIGDLGPRMVLRTRCEFVLNLEQFAAESLTSNHRRNLRKGEKAGLRLAIAISQTALEQHRSLQSNSMLRRRGRGETVDAGRGTEEDAAMIRSGAGQLFQAVRNGEVMSSVLVLRSSAGSYYHSAGTSQAGMTLGASHFLIVSIARHLAAAGCSSFNLGGADPESSLGRFKEGFGTTRVMLVAGRCFVGPAWLLATLHALRLSRGLSLPVRWLLVPEVSRMCLFVANTDQVQSSHFPDGVTFRPLTETELASLPDAYPGFRSRQMQRVARFGASYAYAVFVGEQLAHVSWLLPPAAMDRDEPRVLRGRRGEAEITCCETLPEFRGRGLYPLAIRALAAVAIQHGVKRVYMKTAIDNVASRSGIRKAGLSPGGKVTLLGFQWLARPLVLRFTA